MTMDLQQFIDDFACALKAVDASGQAHKRFRPGIGPFGEADAVKAALAVLQREKPEAYTTAVTKREPDLLIPDLWQIEFKVIRPYGITAERLRTGLRTCCIRTRATPAPSVIA